MSSIYDVVVVQPLYVQYAAHVEKHLRAFFMHVERSERSLNQAMADALYRTYPPPGMKPDWPQELRDQIVAEDRAYVMQTLLEKTAIVFRCVMPRIADAPDVRALLEQHLRTEPSDHGRTDYGRGCYDEVCLLPAADVPLFFPDE